ncbi:hypothetical protein NQ314_014347 [Rhamnusium bicolor]|uniref:Regulatory protein zeste n=1 Tax=Rhamnusium bicolor TaxID=1586634 RepID=A0AAV8X1M8_9CUCU|nr:hypothetical protein NQ314_014347 [Rhamnusium bicolor]
MAFKMNENHWNVLIDFMESHKEFARGQFVGPNGKTTQRKFWEELSGKLNSLGHGIRPVEKWQKSWADIKYTIKKKAFYNNQQLVATGGGPKMNKSLNIWEERAVAILGKTFHEGVERAECGVSNNTCYYFPLR